MTSLQIQDLTKKFGQFTALDSVNLDIPDGKFVCLLGPSGCGKTTLLRLIAGLDEVTSGSVLVDGVAQAGIPAHKRNFGMVFQSLALFPHLNIAENITYPLKIRGADKATCRKKAAELLDLVQLPGIEDRRIHQLSGGQRQRVAIARGLAMNPKLFLLDEPLSALDAKLREHMQIELRQLQQKLNITTIVVTHDQREALTMADIVIVMKDGVIQQAGSPIEIYRSPANAFVADFIGSSNLIPCKIRDEKRIDLQGYDLDLIQEIKGDLTSGDDAIMSVRPEDVVISTEKLNGLTGEIGFIRDLGSSVEISVCLKGQKILSVSTPKSRPDVSVGQQVGLSFEMDRCTVMPS